MPSLRSSLLFQASLAELVRTLPARQLLLFWLALFSTFASMGLLLDVMAGGRTPIFWLATNALVSGGVAVATTAMWMRRRWLAFALVVIAYLVYMLAVLPEEPRSPPGRLFWDALVD